MGGWMHERRKEGGGRDEWMDGWMGGWMHERRKEGRKRWMDGWGTKVYNKLKQGSISMPSSTNTN
jgi:hypothetical protein